MLSNHGADRVVSRYGRANTAFNLDYRRYFHNFPVDVGLGTRRARAAALLTMAPIPAATAAGCRCRGRGTDPPFGFSPLDTIHEPWLPQPKEWRDLTVQAESDSDGSMLHLYRDAGLHRPR